MSKAYAHIDFCDHDGEDCDAGRCNCHEPDAPKVVLTELGPTTALLTVQDEGGEASVVEIDAAHALHLAEGLQRFARNAQKSSHLLPSRLSWLNAQRAWHTRQEAAR